MTQAAGTLLVVALMSFVAQDRLLMAAAILLALLAAVDGRELLGILQKGAFPLGIFCLMAFILLPIAMQKISLADMAGRLLTVKGGIAVVAGLGISFIGGKGIGILSSQPTVLAGVIVGTLVAVLFFNGLPAGLIIAAGLISLADEYVG